MTDKKITVNDLYNLCFCRFEILDLTTRKRLWPHFNKDILESFKKYADYEVVELSSRRNYPYASVKVYIDLKHPKKKFSKALNEEEKNQ